MFSTLVKDGARSDPKTHLQVEHYGSDRENIFPMLSKVLQQSAKFFCIGRSGDLTVQFEHKISECTLETRPFIKDRATNIFPKLWKLVALFATQHSN